MGTKKKRRDWFFTLQEGGQWLGNLILLYTNTLDKEKKKTEKDSDQKSIHAQSWTDPPFHT